MSNIEIAVIAALNNKNVIGKDNSLPWHLPEDLKHFKRLTQHTPVIMGRRTFESVGEPLPHRLNIVVSRTLSSEKDIIIVPDIMQALKIAEKYARENEAPRISIVGGENIYREFLKRKLANTAYLTRIDNDIEGDTFFPVELIEQNPDWELTEEKFYAKDEKNPYDMKFQTWRLS